MRAFHFLQFMHVPDLGGVHSVSQQTGSCTFQQHIAAMGFLTFCRCVDEGVCFWTAKVLESCVEYGIRAILV